MKIHFLFITSFFLLAGCKSDKSQEGSLLNGSWWMKEQVIEDGKDITKERWEVWDPFMYQFTKDGKLIVSGGAEPLEPTEYEFSLIGDSTLHVYQPWKGNTIESHYSIMSVGKDTVTMRLNASYIIYPDSVSRISSDEIVYLERAD